MCIAGPNVHRRSESQCPQSQQARVALADAEAARIGHAGERTGAVEDGDGLARRRCVERLLP
jgi:hypothetical protein